MSGPADDTPMAMSRPRRSSPRPSRTNPGGGRRRWLARATALAALVSGAMVAAPTGTPVSHAAPDDVIALVIEGTGNGHGRGLSQWGAYGYAVDHGWDWQRILGHYYGGTRSDTTDPGQRIRVRLTDYDGMGEVGVISHGDPVRWRNSAGNLFSGRSMRVDETGPGVFDVYSSSQIACPSATSLTVPDGPVVKASGYNAAARDVQRFLKTFHDSGIAVDGYFGNQTDAVLSSWQRARGLPVDGTRWDADDAREARSIIAAADGSVTWTKVGTHTQRAGDPVHFVTDGGDAASTDRSDVLGVCSSNGSVTHYRGAIDVVSSSDGNRVVNDVDVEGYVRGVIPREIAASWAYAGGGAGANAVRAQAVAARSYGLAQNRSYTYPGSSQRYATTCDTPSCQVYGGAGRRGSATGSVIAVEHVATDAAVAATANVIRRWPAGHRSAGRIVSTEFSASNGPRTAGGAFPAVDDQGDDTVGNPLHRWTRIVDADTFAARHGLGQITGASMQPTTNSAYVGFDGIWFDDIVVTGTTGTYRRQAWDFRNEMGFSSPGFTVRVIRENTTSTSMAFIGDSVGNGITASNGEFDRLVDGTFTTDIVDAVDSRCTTREACRGTTGVEAAEALPDGVDLVLVELGYNDDPAGFASDVDEMMGVLTRKGVGSVAWVNLADIRTSNGSSVYARSNAALRAAATRWSNLTVLDWDAASDTPERPRWFRRDGIHLTSTGEAEFALFLRSALVDGSDVVSRPRDHYLSPPERIELPVVGRSMSDAGGRLVEVPADVAGVSLNVTMVRPADGGFASVWPCGPERPEVSNLNARAGEIVANNVIAPVSSDGTVCFYSSVGTNFLVDVAGWFPGRAGSESPFVGLLPERRVDTRNGLGGRTAQVGPGAPLQLTVAGVPGSLPDGTAVTVPTDVDAVAVNVTVARAADGGYATVWPCDSDRPTTSNVNYEAMNPTGNGVVAPVGSDGTICVETSSAADVIVDLAGYFGGGSGESPFSAAVPTRLVDTREGLGAPEARVGPSRRLDIAVRGALLDGPDGDLRVPEDASAVAMNLTVVDPSGGGYATVWPCQPDLPVVSNLNFATRSTRANSVITPISADGTVCVHLSADAHVVVDVAGWFRGGDDASFSGVVPQRLVDTRFAVGPVPS